MAETVSNPNSGAAEPSLCGGVSRGRSLAFISDLVNAKNLLRYARNKNIVKIDKVGALHRDANILFIDHFSKWTSPPEALASLIRRAGRCADGYTLEQLHARGGLTPHHATAEFVGFKRFLCSKTETEVAIPILKERGRLSPVHGWNSIKASVSRLVRSFVSLYESGRCDYLMTLGLTYPKEFSLLLLSDFEGTLEKAASCLRLFIRRFEAAFYEGAELCVHANTHAWASETPFEPHLHHHLNFPNCILVRYWTCAKCCCSYAVELSSCPKCGYARGVLTKKLVRVQPGFFKGREPDPEKLELLRELWKKTIVDVFGRVIPIDNWTSNLKPQYIHLKQRARLVHRLKYCSRRPMSDFFEYYHDDDCPPDRERMWFVLNLFCYKNPRHHYGWSIGSVVNVQSAPAHSCPICHAPAKVLEIAKTVPPDFHIIIWYHGLWDWIPPPGYHAKSLGAALGGEQLG